ncbi:A/G-specific adenine glycosylase [Celeribacter indicus]|uniref:Adenine DNA glycosylase n=1 Tax=Celeribacter indicus TaxID=1208324 RepID=A0A0B5DY07_9RHOB|nr:A/G-specific adenine glycosylase [Celeribacter indicus]AJE45102.1 A/G-specific adenine glycosylase [Celeribacter indicus]SDX27420.1 A/G-specific DNA-adenine glycosylase [Celeribacter indicus]
MRDALKQSEISDLLLEWYDRHARSLPWRVSPDARRAGIRPDPYRVWLSEIMLQQTTVAAVKAYFERFTSLWPDVTALADAEDDMVLGEWAGLGYYARARNLLKCARVIRDDHGGRFPPSRPELQALPGIGPYTSAAIAAIAFDRAETVVDGNVERVVSRLFRIETPLPAAKPELTARAETLTPGSRPGDYAQAMMDLGATVCTPRSPACAICPIASFCAARAAGDQPRFPLKAPRKAKPTRHGHAYVARTAAGEWILEKRPEKGLLGGMLGWPGTDWQEAHPQRAPFSGAWTEIGEVRHTFTHFHLVLTVHAARHVEPTEGYVLRGDNSFRASDLPTVMRKAFDLAQHFLDD